MKELERELLSRNINLRLSSRDYLAVCAEAERLNVGNADVLRLAWTDYLAHKELLELFVSLEARMERKIFEMLVAVAGLSPEERSSAYQVYKQKISNGGQ